MLKLASHITGHDKIKNIIFDFGGVICDLDIKRTQEKFREFGAPKAERIVSIKEQDLRFEQLVGIYELGNISSDDFRKIIQDHYLITPSGQAVDDTWNALLVGIPDYRIRLLEEIKKSYRIFLLSNSNEIHYLHYLQMFQKISGYHDFNDLFEKAYFSFQIHLSKPGKEIFEFVLSDSRLLPEETLFIDDTLKHVETAKVLLIHGYHLNLAAGEEITNLFY
jgi:glucose-1-phosphatase